jgi:hypothetical protein
MSKPLDFVDITEEEIKKAGRGSSGTSSLLSLQEGDTLLRVMPPWAVGKRYYRAYKMHFALPDLVHYGLEVDAWFNSPCLSEALGKCPLCALANKAKALGTRNADTGLLNLSKSIRAKQQYIANVVDMNNIEQGVVVLPFGKKIFDDLQGLFARKGNLTHPLTGFNLVVTKRKIPNQTWFDYSVSLDEKSDISSHWDTFKSQLHDLDTFPTLPEYEDVSNKVESIELIAPNTVMTARVQDDGYTPSSRNARSEELDDILASM